MDKIAQQRNLTTKIQTKFVLINNQRSKVKPHTIHTPSVQSDHYLYVNKQVEITILGNREQNSNETVTFDMIRKRPRLNCLQDVIHGDTANLAGSDITR